MADFEIVSSALCIIGESPTYRKNKEEFWWIDINGKSLHCLDLSTNTQRAFILKEQPGCLFIDSQDKIHIACETGIYVLQKDGTCDILYSIKPQGKRYNDGKIGPDGTLWIGTISPELQGCFYKIDSHGKVKVLLEGIGNSNGLAWNTKKRKFYLNDTYKHSTYVFDYDDNYELRNSRILRDWGEENPDGMVIDGTGSLYVALFGGARIEKISGTTGEILRKIYLPVPNVTSLCFIDENFRELLVTTGAYNTDLKQYPFAGSVFKIFLNDRGD